MNKGALGMIAFWLVIIGGLNWGLVGLGGWNIVANITGGGGITNIIYDLVGLSALYMIFTMKK